MFRVTYFPYRRSVYVRETFITLSKYHRGPVVLDTTYTMTAVTHTLSLQLAHI